MIVSMTDSVMYILGQARRDDSCKRQVGKGQQRYVGKADQQLSYRKLNGYEKGMIGAVAQTFPIFYGFHCLCNSGACDSKA